MIINFDPLAQNTNTRVQEACTKATVTMFLLLVPRSTTAAASLMPATNEVGPEGRTLTYEVDMALGDSFLAIPEVLEEGDYEPPDWPPSGNEEEDEAPPAEREAEAAPESPRRVVSPRGVWRPASPPAQSAATTRETKCCRTIALSPCHAVVFFRGRGRHGHLCCWQLEGTLPAGVDLCNVDLCCTTMMVQQRLGSILSLAGNSESAASAAHWSFQRPMERLHGSCCTHLCWGGWRTKSWTLRGSGDHVQDPGASVNHQLHVDRVVEVAVDVHLLVQRWPLDPNMGAVDGPYDARKAVHGVELPLQVGELRWCWPPKVRNIYRTRAQLIDPSCANVRYSSEGRRL